MEIVNLLEFLNKAKCLYALDYSVCDGKYVDLLNLMIDDEQFTQKVDLGVIYIKQKGENQYAIVDGLHRIISLSLLLHALCECYKKTTPRNEKAINTIRNKYLLNNSKSKLRLNEKYHSIYEKIILGEKLSGKEKNTPMFRLLHSLWSRIKEEKLQASKILVMLQKIYVTVVYCENISQRDLYYTLHKDNKTIDHFMLIENYLKNIGIKSEWDNIKRIYSNEADLYLFFKDFFITKFNYNEYTNSRLYEFFVNYFETMLQFMPEDNIIAKIKKEAMLYRDIININISEESIKEQLIRIKMHKGEDTYAYILNIYGDYIDGNITEATFIEILSTIDEYLRNRLKTPNNVSFNELVQYLNAFITCK